jgi:hypothetical protein
MAFDPANLPPILTTREVCQLAHCSAVTLWRRRRVDPTWLPLAPAQLGRELTFLREDVLRALGLAGGTRGSELEERLRPPPVFDEAAFRAAKKRLLDERRLDRQIAKARANQMAKVKPRGWR